VDKANWDGVIPPRKIASPATRTPPTNQSPPHDFVPRPAVDESLAETRARPSLAATA
jgi:hypothetical protein